MLTSFAKSYTINILTLLVIIVLCHACSQKPDTLFKKLDPSKTGIHFNNEVEENDSINPIDLEFLYNGGRVAVGDFDNNGFPDLYFTASISGNKMYLNKGDLSFNDVTVIQFATNINSAASIEYCWYTFALK